MADNRTSMIPVPIRIFAAGLLANFPPIFCMLLYQQTNARYKGAVGHGKGIHTLLGCTHIRGGDEWVRGKACKMEKVGLASQRRAMHACTLQCDHACTVVAHV